MCIIIGWQWQLHLVGYIFKRKPKKKQKKNQKMNSSKPGVVERLVNRVLKYDNSKLPDNLESTLNHILK
ncbi:MAG: hypothetical protein FH756_13705, partial [Firmicutes bacterium]|nr:hypothetical protein [Bacillota bacterium]